MKFSVQKKYFGNFFKKIDFGILKKIFFLSSISYFLIYFFNNLGQISFNLSLGQNRNYLFFSFLFCILSIYLNAFAWKNIIRWFGKYDKRSNLISFYVLTNILKYVPGGIWHFLERFNFIKNISNSQLAFYSTLVEPYFMLCASFLLASLGVIFSPIYLFLIIPLIFLNRNLINFVLRGLESLKGKTSDALKLKNANYKLEERINLSSFFPTKALLFEVGFVFSKFIGFLICFNALNSNTTINFMFLFVIFCLSWSIGLIVPTAPSGIGVFESFFLLFAGKTIPQSTIFASLIYFRVISTSADLLCSLPFLLKKIMKRF